MSPRWILKKADRGDSLAKKKVGEGEQSNTRDTGKVRALEAKSVSVPKRKALGVALVKHAYEPSTQAAEAGRALSWVYMLSSRTTRAMWRPYLKNK